MSDKLIVYRFEDKAGIGIFQSPKRAIIKVRRSFDWSGEFHPMPNEDSFSRAVMQKLKYEPRYWLFGFISIGQLANWFNRDNLINDLFKAGAVIGVYRCSHGDVICRERQLIFRREKAMRIAEIIDRLELEEWSGP